MSDNPNRRLDIKFSEALDIVMKEFDEDCGIKVSTILVTRWIAKHEQFKIIMRDVKDKLEEILK